MKRTVQASVVLAGFTLMALEILAFRVIGKTFGTALRETSMVIAVFLTAMSLGYYLGGQIGDRFPHLGTLATVLLLAGLTILIVPTFDGLVSERIFSSSLPLPLHSFLVTSALFVLPTVLLSSISPIAVRLLIMQLEGIGSVAGGISALSTFGSIAGSLAAAFFLLDVFQSVNRTLHALALLMLATAVVNAGLAFRQVAYVQSLWNRHQFLAVTSLLLMTDCWSTPRWSRSLSLPVAASSPRHRTTATGSSFDVTAPIIRSWSATSTDCEPCTLI